MERLSIVPRVERRGGSRRLGDLMDLVLAAIERSRQRQALMNLDDWMLKDIGLTRLDMERETEKPFWRP